MLQFMRNLIGVKADKAVQAGIEALVRWDPQSASEAELRSMEQHLDQLGQQVAQARQNYERSAAKRTQSSRCRHSGWRRLNTWKASSRQKPTQRRRQSWSAA